MANAFDIPPYPRHLKPEERGAVCRQIATDMLNQHFMETGDDRHKHKQAALDEMLTIGMQSVRERWSLERIAALEADVKAGLARINALEADMKAGVDRLKELEQYR